VETNFHTAKIVTEIFEGMIRERKYDVSELGLSYFLRTFESDDPPFLAIPVFPQRCFRHSAIYINVASGIRNPEDLAGKTIGELAMYGHDAGVWPKGILSDEFGVRPEECRWIIGGLAARGSSQSFSNRETRACYLNCAESEWHVNFA
jgi:4,5-dihydroxyphthalate decarboxylase